MQEIDMTVQQKTVIVTGASQAVVGGEAISST
jgi:hypothetical protein